MAGINSTATTPEELAEQRTAENATADIIQATSDYCVSMQAFFDLAEREITG